MIISIREVLGETVEVEDSFESFATLLNYLPDIMVEGMREDDSTTSIKEAILDHEAKIKVMVRLVEGFLVGIATFPSGNLGDLR